MSKIETIRSNITKHYEKQKEEYEKKRQSDNRRRWGPYYHSKQWRTLRNQYYVEHPICEVCEIEGRAIPTEEIHHLHVYGSADTEQEKWKLLLNYNNLCACCKYHHNLFHEYLKKNNLNECTITDLIKYEKIATGLSRTSLVTFSTST